MYLTLGFSWLSPLLHLGHKRRLEESDMYSILPEYGSELLGEELQRYYITVIYSWITLKSLICDYCEGVSQDL